MIVYEGAEGARQAAVTLRPTPGPVSAPGHRPSGEVERELEAERALVDALTQRTVPEAEAARDEAQAALGRVLAEKRALIADLLAHKTIQDDRDRREGILPRGAIMVPTGGAGAIASLLSDVEKAELRIQALERQQEQEALVAANTAEQWLALRRAQLAAEEQRAGALEEELRRSRAAEAAPPPPPEKESWKQRVRAAFAQLGMAPPAED